MQVTFNITRGHAMSTAKIITLGLLLGFGIQFLFAWTAPSTAAPGGNVAGPLTVGATAQTKSGPLRLTGGGGYGAGMLTVGDVSLNDHPSNQWLYVGDVNGSIYGGKGLAANNLYSASYMYADLIYDTSNSGYYINPDSISNVNKIRSISTAAGDAGTTLVTKDYLDAKTASGGVLPGTQCGAWSTYGPLYPNFPCNGHTPNVSCPAGYYQAYTAGSNSDNWVMSCIKA